MVHHKDRAKVLNQARLAIAGVELGPLEHRIIHKDGTVRWIRNKIAVTKDADGTPTAYDGLINDITDLKKAQAAEALHNRQLIQADKLASLGILVSGIAHEINNPNNFIMLNMQLFARIWKDIAPSSMHIIKRTAISVLPECSTAPRKIKSGNRSTACLRELNESRILRRILRSSQKPTATS